MGDVKQPHKVKLITGMISNNPEFFLKVQDLLSEKFGNIDLQSRIMDFLHTNYYNQEMGENLKRKFISFQRLIFPTQISNVKLTTNRFEKEFSVNGKRKINLDPGYITDAKLVLVTTKNYSHRVYLDKGIYAEVTLYFKDGSFQYFDWTYPDYRTSEYINFFNEVRKIYLEQIRPYEKPET